MTGLPAACAVSTMACTSSNENWRIRGPPMGVPTPPVVQILIQSAPACILCRAFRRHSSGPSQMPSGTPGSRGKSELMPAGSVWSLWPPNCDRRLTLIMRRGPGMSPCSTASFMPRSTPPASRMDVNPPSSVSCKVWAVLSTARLGGWLLAPPCPLPGWPGGRGSRSSPASGSGPLDRIAVHLRGKVVVIGVPPHGHGGPKPPWHTAYRKWCLRYRRSGGRWKNRALCRSPLGSPSNDPSINGHPTA
jgi:hypothetical protein